MSRGVRRRILDAAVLAVAISFFPEGAIAASQTAVRFGCELPPLYLRVCWNLKAAQEQASLAADHANLPGDYKELGAYEHAECEVIHTVVMPTAHEPTINPFVGWAPVFDPKGTENITSRFDGKIHYMRFKIARRDISTYRARVAYNDQVRDAWIELPEQPYVLAYLQATRQQPKNICRE